MIKKTWLLLILFLFFALPTWAKELKVAVLPFKINAPEDLSYVQEGLQNMLSTRLYVPGKIQVVEEELVKKALKGLKGPLTVEKAREIGRALGVDYVLLGSVTTFGKQVSLDAQLVPVKGDRPPMPLYAQATSLDDIIPKVSVLARKAVASLMGGEGVSPPVETVAKPEPLAKTQTLKAEGTPPFSSPTKMHPERLFRTELEKKELPPESKPTPPVSSQTKVKKREYKYSEIDPWPDYPPEEDDYGVPEVQEPTKAVKPKKKGHSWSKLLPWNWFRKDKEEPALKKEPITPPPPPPPLTTGTPPEKAPPSQAPSQAKAPSQAETPSSKEVSPPSTSSGGTWQWY